MKPWDFVTQVDSALYAHQPSSFDEKNHCLERRKWELLPTSQRTFCLILISFLLLISLIIHLIGVGLLSSGPTVVVTKTFVKIEKVVVFRV
jgi:disulfide bond formation protein DsbB